VERYGAYRAEVHRRRSPVRKRSTMEGLAVIGGLAVLVAGCQVSDEQSLLRKATSQVRYPRGSRVQYAAVPAGTIYAPGAPMGCTNAVRVHSQGNRHSADSSPWRRNSRLCIQTTGRFRGHRLEEAVRRTRPWSVRRRRPRGAPLDSGLPGSPFDMRPVRTAPGGRSSVGSGHGTASTDRRGG
jgi:hypothetical protein